MRAVCHDEIGAFAGRDQRFPSQSVGFSTIGLICVSIFRAQMPLKVREAGPVLQIEQVLDLRQSGSFCRMASAENSSGFCTRGRFPMVARRSQPGRQGACA